MTSLEISKLLREAEWPRPAQWFWRWRILDQDGYSLQFYDHDSSETITDKDIPAVSVEELLEEIPVGVILQTMARRPHYWARRGAGFKNLVGRSDNPADALANLWLELKKKGMI